MAGETEFEDLLIKHGIIRDPEEENKKQEQHTFNIVDAANCSSASEEEDDDDDDFFQEYAKRRMAELSQADTVREISRPDFVKEVTEASKRQPVVVHLYQDAVEASSVLRRDMRKHAGRYPAIRFVEIVATRCVPDYPDALVPTVIYYRDGAIVQKVTNARPEGLLPFLDAVRDANRDSNSNNDSSSNNNK